MVTADNRQDKLRTHGWMSGYTKCAHADNRIALSLKKGKYRLHVTMCMNL